MNGVRLQDWRFLRPDVKLPRRSCYQGSTKLPPRLLCTSVSYKEVDLEQDDVVTYYSDVVNALYTTQLGEAAVNISFEEQCLFTQCTIGSWQADVLREATGTDIGMVNSGSLG